MKCRALATIAIFGLALVAPAELSAQATRETFRTPLAYVHQLLGETGAAPIGGPQQVTIEHSLTGKIASETGPIARLQKMLTGCRLAGFSAGFSRSTPPQWTVLRQSLECLGPTAEDKSVYLVITATPDGAVIGTVTALLGGPIYWTPPSPNPPGWKPAYDPAKFPQYRDSALALLGQLSGGEVASGTGHFPMTFWDDRVGKVLDVSLKEAAEVLKPCRSASARMAKFTVDNNKPPHDAVLVYLKCDSRSSAPEELDFRVTFSDGKIDGLSIEPAQGYQIPPPAIAKAKSDG